MASPSWTPYPYRRQSQPTTVGYKFTDDRGRLYTISFARFDFPASPLREHGVVLDLTLQEPAARDDGHDPRLEATMVAVVEQVLRQNQAAIIVWVCSADRRQQRARHQLFNRWYRHYQRQGGPLAILKKDRETSPGEYISALYRADHPDRAALEDLLLDDVDKL